MIPSHYFTQVNPIKNTKTQDSGHVKNLIKMTWNT